VHQVKQCVKVVGHVKPNADLKELLITAKEDISKLTKKDSVIVLGGSNDFERNGHGKNLTLIVKFLEATQLTNVLLIDVPLRYDLNTIPNINMKIMNHNKKLHKITKSFKHVQLVKAITNRDLFTRHGRHLSKEGKEAMTREIIEKLLINVDSPKVDVAHLPWKIEPVKQLAASYLDAATFSSVKTVDSNKENIYSSSETVDLDKDNIQAKDKVINRNTKLQRNCPKQKSGDFLWN